MAAADTVPRRGLGVAIVASLEIYSNRNRSIVVDAGDKGSRQTFLWDGRYDNRGALPGELEECFLMYRELGTLRPSREPREFYAEICTHRFPEYFTQRLPPR